MQIVKAFLLGAALALVSWVTACLLVHEDREGGGVLELRRSDTVRPQSGTQAA